MQSCELEQFEERIHETHPPSEKNELHQSRREAILTLKHLTNSNSTCELLISKITEALKS